MCYISLLESKVIFRSKISFDSRSVTHYSLVIFRRYLEPTLSVHKSPSTLGKNWASEDEYVEDVDVPRRPAVNEIGNIMCFIIIYF